jgi:hypothetical protein
MSHPDPFRDFSDDVIERAEKGKRMPGFLMVTTAKQARVRYLAARTACLGPAMPAAATAATRLADAAVKLEGTAWHLHALGLAQYRAGQLDEAARTIQASLDDPKWEGKPCNWLVLAMINHDRGQPNAAQKNLETAVKWMDDAASKLPEGVVHPLPGLDDHDSLACLVLRREAEALIGRPKK